MAPTPTTSSVPTQRSQPERTPEGEIWGTLIGQIKFQTPHLFNNFLVNATFREVQHNNYIIEVPNAFERDQLHCDTIAFKTTADVVDAGKVVELDVSGGSGSGVVVENG